MPTPERARGGAHRQPGCAERGRAQLGGAQSSRGERQQDADRKPREQPQAPHGAEAGVQDVADHRGVQGRPERGGAGGRPLKDDAERRGCDAQSRRRKPDRAGAAREGLARLPPTSARLGDAAQRRPPDRRREREAAGRQRDRQIGEPADRAEGAFGHRARAAGVDQFVDARGGRGTAGANREVEPPGDRVGVGGDDAVGGRVDPVPEAAAELHGHGLAAAAGMLGRTTVHAPAVRVVDAHRAESNLDRFVEAQLDPIGRPLDLGAASG